MEAVYRYMTHTKCLCVNVSSHSLDPNNRRALEGMHRIDNSSSKLDSSYYMPVGEEENTDTTYDAGGDVADSDNEVRICIIFQGHCPSAKQHRAREIFLYNFMFCCSFSRMKLMKVIQKQRGRIWILGCIN